MTVQNSHEKTSLSRIQTETITTTLISHPRTLTTSRIRGMEIICRIIREDIIQLLRTLTTETRMVDITIMDMEEITMAKKSKINAQEEKEIHAQAVKLRKMTDEQLVTAFKNAQNAPESASKLVKASTKVSVENFLAALSEGKCKGIKGATVFKLETFAKEMGAI